MQRAAQSFYRLQQMLGVLFLSGIVGGLRAAGMHRLDEVVKCKLHQVPEAHMKIKVGMDVLPRSINQARSTAAKIIGMMLTPA